MTTSRYVRYAVLTEGEYDVEEKTVITTTITKK
jgi:hypothetical protein